ncbi:MAG: RNA methyltransferase, partial [Deltaproteobacteria bacterium]|nr:RNA methyltransferase [Deltaproteobacteria bacterium]
RKIGFQGLRKMLESGTPHVLLFGTAWGLSDDFLEKADFILDPIMGDADYNHLSVRSAVSIILDRLKGDSDHLKKNMDSEL